jgi:cytosine deaminase
MTASLVVSGARLADGALVDVSIDDGMIARISPAGSHEPGRGEHVHAAGRLLTQSLVNGHAHLDKTLMGASWQPHLPGRTVKERVAAERLLRLTVDAPIDVRARRLATDMAAMGVGVVRTHVDVDATLGTSAVQDILALRQSLRDVIEVQIVAFPQSGILHEPGTAELLSEALRAGVDLVGGLDPAGFDGDADGHLDVVFGLAERFGSGVDIHLHELGEPGLAQLRDISARATAAGMGGRVVVSHAYALGTAAIDDVRQVADALAASGVAVMTNGPVGMTPPVLTLREHGVTVFAGSDNIRDAWWPYGTADIVDTARNIAYQSDFRTDEELAVAFDLVTGAAADALGIGRRGIRVGGPADLVLFDAETVAEVVAAPPARLLVLKAGRAVTAAPELRRSQPVVHHPTTTSSTNPMGVAP